MKKNNMNKAQKIILSVYITSGFITYLYVFIHDAGGCSNKTAFFQSCAISNLLLLPVLICIIYGIPTFFLYKVWKDKK